MHRAGAADRQVARASPDLTRTRHTMKAFPYSEAIGLFPIRRGMTDVQGRPAASVVAEVFEEAPAAHQSWLRERERELEDFDAEKVSQLKDAIGDGSFRVDSTAVAEALLARLDPARTRRG
jgi:flagellar biosynthesis anti-sigma factor FlgM